LGRGAQEELAEWRERDVGQIDMTKQSDVGRGMLAVASLLIALTIAGCSSGKAGHVGNPHSPILLFNGTGTSPNDVKAIESLLVSNQLEYATADSTQLDAMDEAQLRKHRLLIVPGGNFMEIGKALAPKTGASIRSAVGNGLNYLGVCAGGYLAGDCENGFNLASGVKFKCYSIEKQGIRKAVATISLTGDETLEQYWEDGPEFTGWGAVVGRYADGTPAVVEGEVGSGWVVLVGTHPEAPESWRREFNFTTPIKADHAFAAKVILAALDRTALPTFVDQN
jgi:glutamine amidotransferase-like uncharacterized protein